MRIVSWNVNGLRACERKGFSDWLPRSEADLVALQEVRSFEHQLPEHLLRPRDWHAHFAPAERGGYSGVGLYSRKEPDLVEKGMGEARFDVEGRLQTIRLGKLTVVNGYFPNGGGKEGDNSRVPFKLDFYDLLFRRLERDMKRGERILVLGDLNTAHKEIDLARPKANEKTSGFLPEERAELDRWMEAGWVDTFRQFEKDGGHYSWWSQRFGARARNVGWRIDYVLASPGAMPFVKAAAIHPLVMGSDHCPISVILDPAITR
ncbi:MAG: exodeoxyribonuclease III [Myxococcota bacterium]